MAKKFLIWGRHSEHVSSMCTEEEDRWFGLREPGDYNLYSFELSDITFLRRDAHEVNEESRWGAALEVYHAFCAGWLVRDTGKTVRSWP